MREHDLVVGHEINDGVGLGGAPVVCKVRGDVGIGDRNPVLDHFTVGIEPDPVHVVAMERVRAIERSTLDRGFRRLVGDDAGVLGLRGAGHVEDGKEEGEQPPLGERVFHLSQSSLKKPLRGTLAQAESIHALPPASKSSRAIASAAADRPIGLTPR
jgi:hypothetical protein